MGATHRGQNPVKRFITVVVGGVVGAAHRGLNPVKRFYRLSVFLHVL